jgi:lipoate-protein ligase A
MADVLVAGRKVAGAAQRRGRFGLLHQGSVQGITLPSDIAQHFTALLAAEAIPLEYSSALIEQIDRLVATRYGTENWLKRR